MAHLSKAIFSVTPLANHGVLVQGTDKFGRKGKTRLRSEVWSAVKSYREQKLAEAEFDTTVSEFFGPLIEAAEKLNYRSTDEDAIVVIEPAIEGVEAAEEQHVHLDEEGVIIRILEEGDHDRLIWVDKHTLDVIV